MARLPRGKYNGRFKFARIPPSLASRKRRKSCDSRHVLAVRSYSSARPTESSRRGCKVLMTRANRFPAGSGNRDARVPTHRGISGRGSNDEPPHNFFVERSIRSFIEITFSSPDQREIRPRRAAPCRSMCNIRVISASSIFIAICVRK